MMKQPEYNLLTARECSHIQKMADLSSDNDYNEFANET